MTTATGSVAFQVRPATLGDLRALALLRTALFEELGQKATAHFNELTEAAFADALERGSCCAWVAQSEAGEVIGAVALLLFPRLPSPNSVAPREGYLVNVYTVPQWRRRGVAAGLVAAAISSARELGLGRIRLHATPEGQVVYTAAGFRLRPDAMELRL